jgi:hypothetical protein
VTPPATVIPLTCSILSHTEHWSAWKLYNLKEFHRRPWVTLSQIHSCLINTLPDSLWLTLVHHLMSIPIDLVTDFNLVLANTASAPMHTGQTNCPTAYALVCHCVSCLLLACNWWHQKFPCAWWITSQLGTPRGRYDEYSS